MLLFVYRQDSILYSLAKNNDEEAKALIRRAYHKDEDTEEIFAVLKY